VRVWPGAPFPLGPQWDGQGTNFSIFSENAERVELCLFDPAVGGGWTERRIALPDATHGVWHAFVPDVPVGQRYGLRVHGPWEPVRGRWHNHAKLLLDPYARAIAFPPVGPAPGRRLALMPELFGHTVDDAFRGDVSVPDGRDSAPFAPHGIVGAGPAGFDWEDDAPPYVHWADTVIYEAHVKGFTQRMSAVPKHLRGTYAGLAHPAAITHLQRLGVTSIQLLPVHTIGDEDHLARRGRVNYWGYSTLGFFAPHPGYAASRDPLGAVAEFKTMVKALHAAGIEVLLDVVYNHTCEAGRGGPMLSWRGLDAATYYRMDARGEFVDTTGCGNSLDFGNPRVIQLTLDSLRHWVTDLHVDGFRFDLATTLARGRDGFDPDHPFLVALRTDPVLAGVKVIAEPWDLGPHGWRTGQFPMPFAEWNDHFRDGIREFWLPGGARTARGEPGGGVRDLATRLAGSADTFDAHRGPLASINFVTAHDGFTLADTASYDHKHNEANGESNRDGSDNNRSWNHGVEGPTEDVEIVAARRRSIRNMLGSLLLATGVPMLVAGDEFGRTQGGNNNAYCADDETAWLDWDLATWQQDLLQTVRYLLRVRREHPVVRQDRFFAGRPVHADGTKDLAWFGPDGVEMENDRWHDPAQRVLQMYLHAVVRGRQDHHVDSSLLIIVQAQADVVELRLPSRSWAHSYDLVWDSAYDAPPGLPRGPRQTTVPPRALLNIPPNTMRVYRIPPRTDRR